MRPPVSFLLLLLLGGSCAEPEPEQGPLTLRLLPADSARVAVRADRRDAFLLTSPEHVDVEVELAAGDRLRFAVGAPALEGDEEPRTVGFRVSWTVEGAEEVVLDEAMRRTGGPWKERDVVVTAGQAGRGTLRLATWAETPTPAAFAEVRVVPAELTPLSRPNLVVYVVDTLRADHLSCYGARNPTSPRIDALAADGFLFEAFRAVAPWTRPTTATLLTGYQPSWHGMGKELPLPASLDTLAETLRAAGYSTWAAVANPQVGEVSLGFEQGFDRFVTHRGIGGDRRGEEVVATSTRLGDLALRWIEAAGDEPFFLYLHSLDPHTPYQPPDQLAERFAAGYEGPLADVLLVTKELQDRGDEVTAADLRYVEDVYDDEVRHQDREIGRLVDALESRGVLANTVVVVTSDHGEEFLDHGGWNHGYRMFEELLHVPFVLWLPPGLRAELEVEPRRIAAPVSQVDFLPGLVEVLGVRDTLPRQGGSWAPLLSGGEAELAPFIGIDFQAHEGDEIGAYSDGRYKLIWNSDSGRGTLREELYDLAADPGEQTDLAASEPGILARLRQERDAALRREDDIRVRLRAAGRPDVEPQDETNTERAVLDEEAQRELEALGYGGGD